ncbi:hypothetical protein niasHT_021716 [Heterodera trifolii]|uniref:Uncharacterized protein n=1 Tax=Heterodera trifolii TaxID=157864 RepID=A0ABD2KRV2_9BILA
MDQLDPLYFRINKIEEAHRECARVLEKNPLDQGPMGPVKAPGALSTLGQQEPSGFPVLKALARPLRGLVLARPLRGLVPLGRFAASYSLGSRPRRGPSAPSPPFSPPPLRGHRGHRTKRGLLQAVDEAGREQCGGNRLPRAHFFYEGRPEIALKFYRRILQMGVNSAELYTNLAMCCFYCQQFDLACGCLQQAHSVADQQARGDLKMAKRCLQLALASDADHAESLVNLGILKMHDRRTDEARNLFQMAADKGMHLYEAHFNNALLLHEMGNYAECHRSLKRPLEIFPDHFYSKKLLQRVEAILKS